MSINPYVYLSEGLIFEANDTLFIDKVKGLYPGFFENNEEPNDIYKIAELFNEDQDLKSKYGALDIIAVSEYGEEPTRLIVVKRSKTKTLFDKYADPEGFPFYVDEIDGEVPGDDSYQFTAFLREFERGNYRSRPIIWNEYM